MSRSTVVKIIILFALIVVVGVGFKMMKGQAVAPPQPNPAN